MELILETLGKGIVTIAAVVALTRLNGLRTFSKMSSFDFAVTIATGSLIASALTVEGDFPAALVALTVLIAVQGLISRVRVRWDTARETVDNTPLLLVENGRFLRDNMKAAQISESDVIAKLREANACERDKIRAVVLETTGSISVIYASPDAPLLDGLLDGVRYSPRTLP